MLRGPSTDLSAYEVSAPSGMPTSVSLKYDRAQCLREDDSCFLTPISTFTSAAPFFLLKGVVFQEMEVNDEFAAMDTNYILVLYFILNQLLQFVFSEYTYILVTLTILRFYYR